MTPRVPLFWTSCQASEHLLLLQHLCGAPSSHCLVLRHLLLHPERDCCYIMNTRSRSCHWTAPSTPPAQQPVVPAARAPWLRGRLGYPAKLQRLPQPSKGAVCWPTAATKGPWKASLGGGSEVVVTQANFEIICVQILAVRPGQAPSFPEPQFPLL